MRGSASSSVTSLPMSTSIDANSHPITPPPMIATRGGQLGELEHVVGREDADAVEVEPGQRARRPSRSRSRGCRPRPRCRRRRGRVCAAASATSPRPATTVTLRPFSSDSRPLVSRSTTSCLRAWAWPRSSVGSPASTPNSDAPLDRAQHLGRLEQLLGRDAAPVEARPADPAAPRPARCSARPPRRTARSRSRPGRRRGPRRRIARPGRPPPRIRRSRHRPVVTSDSHSRRTPIRSSVPRSLDRTHGRPLRASAGEEDLDRAGCEDRHAGDGGEDEQRPGAHDAPSSRPRPASAPVPGPRRITPICCSPGARRSAPTRPSRPSRADPESTSMSQRAQRLIEAARKMPVPEGTYAVGLGLLISGHHRVRLPDPRVQGPHQVRVRRAERPLDLRVRRRARVLPAARAGGRPGGRRPPRPRASAAARSSARPRWPAPMLTGGARSCFTIARARRLPRSSTGSSTGRRCCSSASSSRSSPTRCSTSRAARCRATGASVRTG